MSKKALPELTSSESDKAPPEDLGAVVAVDLTARAADNLACPLTSGYQRVRFALVIDNELENDAQPLDIAPLHKNNPRAIALCPSGLGVDWR